MSKCLIKRNFSRGARHYDRHSAVQRECALKILDLAGEKRHSRILEIGCGTGVYTGLLSDKFPGAEITAVDLSRPMVDLAKKKISGSNVRFVVDDGECMPLDGKFDMITSNAAFQWFENLDAAIGSFSEGLSDGGTLCFSMYGPETFKEFQEVLAAHFGAQRLSSENFISPQTLMSMLDRHFDEVVLREEYFKADFGSL
ncbi:MAG: methyltransferase domain-containing protein, partial [Candidatus Omnitrophota bacterium]